ncbi:MAG: FRG domain-containing protein [Rhodospirillales bacterium]|nr:FRG domain-containing protein [Rhodospirillales bacterium]
METIGQNKLWSLTQSGKPIEDTNDSVRKTQGIVVRNYQQLARYVAELQFWNRDFVLVFRGQPKDYRNKVGDTLLRPSLFRPFKGKTNLSFGLAKTRFEDLNKFDQRLIEKADDIFPQEKEVADRLRRQRILRWSILQHYEVCPTPLLDVSHSLRVASSFATDRADGEAFVFVLGIPNLTGAITASIEAGLQVVRLASVCPSSAERPHIQEGYILGEYPEISSIEQKKHYGTYEMDFGRRLIAKFRFNPDTFWKQSPGFEPLLHDLLYPPEDPFGEMIGKSVVGSGRTQIFPQAGSKRRPR